MDLAPSRSVSRKLRLRSPVQHLQLCLPPLKALCHHHHHHLRSRQWRSLLIRRATLNAHFKYLEDWDVEDHNHPYEARKIARSRIEYPLNRLTHNSQLIRHTIDLPGQKASNRCPIQWKHMTNRLSERAGRTRIFKRGLHGRKWITIQVSRQQSYCE